MNAVTLSLVIPVYNEDANLSELVDRCKSVCDAIGEAYEIILVDDGSSDDSRATLRALTVRYPDKVVVVLLNRNYGQHPAVLAGFANSRGEVVVTMDADLQNPPEEIPKLLEKIAGGCDVVGSVRMHRQDSFFRRMPSHIVNSMVSKATGVTMTDYGCMLRAYRRRVVDAVLQCPERSTFIPVLANSFAGKTAEVPVQHEERKNGRSRYNIWRLINLQFDLLTSLTAFPLRLMSIVGGVLAFFGVLAGIFLAVMRIVQGSDWAVGGVFTVLAALFMFTGAQLFGMGLIGEYLGRVYADVRGRPRYFIEEIIRVHSRTPAESGPTVINIATTREHRQ
jgi:undecaprenyl-phosphate 4-deoxy-4-formamido-L-arabinose transferase